MKSILRYRKVTFMALNIHFADININTHYLLLELLNSRHSLYSLALVYSGIADKKNKQLLLLNIPK